MQEIIYSEGLTMTENAYRKVTQDEIEYERMESRLKYQLQYNTDISLARQEGLEQGRTEGEAAATVKLARAMKADGESVDKIVKYTGLSADEVERL